MMSTLSSIIAYLLAFIVISNASSSSSSSGNVLDWDSNDSDESDTASYNGIVVRVYQKSGESPTITLGTALDDHENIYCLNFKGHFESSDYDTSIHNDAYYTAIPGSQITLNEASCNVSALSSTMFRIQCIGNGILTLNFNFTSDEAGDYGLEYTVEMANYQWTSDTLLTKFVMIQRLTECSALYPYESSTSENVIATTSYALDSDDSVDTDTDSNSGDTDTDSTSDDTNRRRLLPLKSLLIATRNKVNTVKYTVNTINTVSGRRLLQSSTTLTPTTTTRTGTTTTQSGTTTTATLVSSTSTSMMPSNGTFSSTTTSTPMGMNTTSTTGTSATSTTKSTTSTGSTSTTPSPVTATTSTTEESDDEDTEDEDDDGSNDLADSGDDDDDTESGDDSDGDTESDGDSDDDDDDSDDDTDSDGGSDDDDDSGDSEDTESDGGSDDDDSDGGVSAESEDSSDSSVMAEAGVSSDDSNEFDNGYSRFVLSGGAFDQCDVSINGFFARPIESTLVYQSNGDLHVVFEHFNCDLFQDPRFLIDEGKVIAANQEALSGAVSMNVMMVSVIVGMAVLCL